jgi:hypothetical protein
MTKSDYATRLRDLADTLDSCQWEHPLCSADLCREVAGLLDKILLYRLTDGEKSDAEVP